MEMPKVMYSAIDMMNSYLSLEFGPMHKIEIVGEFHRTEPCEFYKNGRLGAKIRLLFMDCNPIETFLGCESLAEEIVYNPLGHLVVQDSVNLLILEAIKSQK